MLGSSNRRCNFGSETCSRCNCHPIDVGIRNSCIRRKDLAGISVNARSQFQKCLSCNTPQPDRSERCRRPVRPVAAARVTAATRRASSPESAPWPRAGHPRRQRRVLIHPPKPSTPSPPPSSLSSTSSRARSSSSSSRSAGQIPASAPPYSNHSHPKLPHLPSSLPSPLELSSGRRIAWNRGSSGH